MLNNLSYHGLDHSPSFEAFVAEKLERLENVRGKLSSLHLVASKEKDRYSFAVVASKGKKKFYKKVNQSNVYKASSEALKSFREWLHKS